MYKLINNRFNNLDCVLLVAENKFIPTDPANTDYQQYLAWLEAGNTPTPADEGTQ